MASRDQGAAGEAADGLNGPAGVQARISLVGMFPSTNGAVQQQHLGLWTMPSKDPSLAELGWELEQLLSVQGSPGHSHFRFEYSCFGHTVPILSDAALREALSYFRDQACQLGQLQAAQTCTLYLWPTTSASTTLAQYLQEARPHVAPTSKQVRLEARVGCPQQDLQLVGVEVTGPGQDPTPELSPSSSRVLQHSGSISSSKGQPSPLPGIGAGAWAGGEAGPEPGLPQQGAAAGVLLGLTPVAAVAGLGFSGEFAGEPEPHWGQGAAADVRSSSPVPAAALPREHNNGGGGGSTSLAVSADVSRTGSAELPVPAAAAAAAAAVADGGLQQQQQWEQAEGVSAVVVLQQPQADNAAAAAGVSLRHNTPALAHASHKRPAGDSDPLHGHPELQFHRQQQQQQSDLFLGPRRGCGALNGAVAGAAASALTSVLSSGLTGGTEQGTLSPSWSAGSSRAESGTGLDRADSNKAARRSTAHSPRAEQQRQQLLQPEGTHSQRVSLAQQQQQLLRMTSPTADGAAAAGCAFGSVQQVLMDNTGAAGTNGSSEAAAAAGYGSGNSGAPANGAEFGRPSGYVAMAHLEQLHISNRPPGPLEGLGMAGVGLGYPLGPNSSPLQQATATGLLLAGGSGQLNTHVAAVPGAALPGMPSAAAAAGGAAAAAAAAAVLSGAGGGAEGAGVSTWQVTTAGGRVKNETKTKYADGRFKDEARHQQRLSDMRDRCNALFDGTIRGHFQVEHHKKVVCLVCSSAVVPYEAYHIDAVRKHFVRHHEAWLTQAGCNVDVWRKSCAPIRRTLAPQSASTGRVRKHPAGSAAAAAAGVGGAAAGAGGDDDAAAAAGAEGGSSDELEGAAAAAAADGEDGGESAAAGPSARKGSGRVSSTRLPDGRYKDKIQHEQRMADMEARCSALFNGAVSSHWSITSHKSITCHLCNSSITPYAAYHPDCLRKHFVRRHEDVLLAAGVNVATWSKGIPLGRRKLKAMQLQQQQQMQQQMLLAQQQMLLQSLQQGPGQSGLLAGAAADHMGAAQVPLEMLQLGAVAASGCGGGEASTLWSWLTPTGQQQQQPPQQQQQQQQQGLMDGVSIAVSGPQQQQQQQQLRQFVFGSTPIQPAPQQAWEQQQQQQRQWAAVGMSVPASTSDAAAPAADADMSGNLSSPLLAVVGFGDAPQTGGSRLNTPQAQQAAAPAASTALAVTTSSGGSACKPEPMQQLLLDGIPAGSGMHLRCAVPSAGRQGGGAAVTGTAGRQGEQGPACFPSAGTTTLAAAAGGPGRFLDAGVIQQQQQAQAAAAVIAAAGAAGVHLPSGLAESLALHHQQQQWQPPQAGQPSNMVDGGPSAAAGDRSASLRQLAADWACSPSMGELPPGFGPMSLTPSAAAAEAGLSGAVGANSLTDADFAELLTGDDDDGADLDELLMKHASWVFDTA